MKLFNSVAIGMMSVLSAAAIANAATSGDGFFATRIRTEFSVEAIPPCKACAS